VGPCQRAQAIQKDACRRGSIARVGGRFPLDPQRRTTSAEGRGDGAKEGRQGQVWETKHFEGKRRRIGLKGWAADDAEKGLMKGEGKGKYGKRQDKGERGRARKVLAISRAV